jgi:hypothetical protein
MIHFMRPSSCPIPAAGPDRLSAHSVRPSLRLALAAHFSPAFRRRLAEKTFIAQIRLKDGSDGRWFAFGQDRLFSAPVFIPLRT